MAAVENNDKTITTNVIRDIQVLSDSHGLRDWRSVGLLKSLSDDTGGRLSKADVDFALERRSISKCKMRVIDCRLRHRYGRAGR